jgi:hypothetical protein
VNRCVAGGSSLVVVGDAAWVNPLISALAGLIGALIGGGAVLLAGHLERKERRQVEHSAAVARYWGAVNGYATTLAMLASPAGVVGRIELRLEQRRHGGRLIDRMLASSDAFWQAGGTLRAVATPEDMDAIRAIETVIGAWDVGDPVPEDWASAINLLRLRLESQGST